MKTWEQERDEMAAWNRWVDRFWGRIAVVGLVSAWAYAIYRLSLM
jgi:hypothetical protein